MFYQNESSFNDDFLSNKKPLISFVAKPKLRSNATDENGKKKPAYVVVRKKAALPIRKKLTEVISANSITEAKIKPSVQTSTQKNLSVVKSKPAKSLEENESTDQAPPKTVSFGKSSKTARSKLPNNKAERRTPLKKKPGNWTVSEKSGVRNTGFKFTGIISSLFIKNPDIPVVAKENVEATNEAVFSSRKFSDLNLHKHLVYLL